MSTKVCSACESDFDSSLLEGGGALCDGDECYCPSCAELILGESGVLEAQEIKETKKPAKRKSARKTSARKKSARVKKIDSEDKKGAKKKSARKKSARVKKATSGRSKKAVDKNEEGEENIPLNAQQQKAQKVVYIGAGVFVVLCIATAVYLFSSQDEAIKQAHKEQVEDLRAEGKYVSKTSGGTLKIFEEGDPGIYRELRDEARVLLSKARNFPKDDDARKEPLDKALKKINEALSAYDNTLERVESGELKLTAGQQRKVDSEGRKISKLKNEIRNAKPSELLF